MCAAPVGPSRQSSPDPLTDRDYLDHCWELAGILGVDPTAWTWRRLDKAVETKLMGEWDRASLVAAIIANVNRKPGSRPIQPAELNPLRHGGQSVRRGVPLTADNIGALKIFLGNGAA